MKLFRFLFLFIILLLTSSIFASPVVAGTHDYFFEGDVEFSELGDYIYLDFDVPAGTTKIYFSYSFAPVVKKETSPGKSEDPKGLFSNNVIDIGVFDPDGFRGWSGSNKSSFTIANSADHTSPSYIPGTLQTGTWQVELGIGWVDAGTVLHYDVSIDFSTEAVGNPFEPPDFTPVVLSDSPGWYKGDLHCHSTHSDGSHPMADVFDYAYSIGLDYVALTDHNAISHMYFLPDYQELYDDMLLINGVEMTSYSGHANVYNIVGYIPYQGSTPEYDINAVIDMVHNQGGYFSPNHPFPLNFYVNDHLHGLGWGFPDTDWYKVDFSEVINGPMKIFGFIPQAVNLANIELWDILQDDGYTLTIRGGSDDHNAGHGGGTLDVYLGEPTTVVYADELSADAILDGIAKGHCFIMATGPDGAELYLEASTGKETVIMGDTIAGDPVELSARVVNGNGSELSFLWNGVPAPDHSRITVDQDDFTYTWEFFPLGNSRFRLELWDGLELLAITNSLYVEPAATDDDDDDNDDSTDDDDDNDDDNQTGDDDSGNDDDDNDDDDDSSCGC